MTPNTALETMAVDVRGACGHEWRVRTNRAGMIPYVGDAPVLSHVVDHRARFRCPECHVMATVSQRVPRRVCACGAILSRYNRDDACAPCQRAERERERLRNPRGPAGKVTVREEILAVLARGQANVSQIVWETNRLDHEVRKGIFWLLEEGEVERGPVVEGYRVYRIADREALVKSAPA